MKRFSHARLLRLALVFAPVPLLAPVCAWAKAALLPAPISTVATAPAGQSAASAVPKPALSDAEQQAIAGVSADSIRDVTTALTAPDMEGRGAAQPGGERAARYIAARMAKLGLKPLGDNGAFLQRVPLSGYKIRPDSTLAIDGKTDSGKPDGKIFAYERDFKAESYATNQTRLRKSMMARGDLVFVGYGVSAPSLQRDDLKGASLRGKIAVLNLRLPPNAQGTAGDATTWKSVRQNLARRGITAILTLTQNRNFLPYDGQDVRRAVGLTGGATKDDPALPPCVMVSRLVGEALFAGSGTTLDDALTQSQSDTFTARDLHKTARLALHAAFESEAESAPAYNVVGILEGSDPNLRKEALVYTAHYDAFGRETDGRVFPGAADNALGVGNLLSVAEALTRLPVRPRRSIIFLSTIGEEMGLLGAAYWTTHPTFPLARVVADLNFDGYGTEVWGSVTAFYGFGLGHSDLAPTLKNVAKILGNGMLADPAPQEQAFQRGDQWEFARHGVPAAQIAGSSGDIFTLLPRVAKFEREDYHKPTDTIRPDWDWRGPQKLAQYYLVIGLRVSNADARPVFAPGSPFAPASRAPKRETR